MVKQQIRLAAGMMVALVAAAAPGWARAQQSTPLQPPPTTDDAPASALPGQPPPVTPPAPAPQSIPPAPIQPAPADPSPMVGCSKDTECKGDRICDRGSCVWPAASPEARAPAPTPPLVAQPAPPAPALPVPAFAAAPAEVFAVPAPTSPGLPPPELTATADQPTAELPVAVRVSAGYGFGGFSDAKGIGGGRALSLSPQLGYKVTRQFATHVAFRWTRGSVATSTTFTEMAIGAGIELKGSSMRWQIGGSRETARFARGKDTTRSIAGWGLATALAPTIGRYVSLPIEFGFARFGASGVSYYSLCAGVAVHL